MAKNNGKNKGWDNLKPCKPGETHNPNGRPKGSVTLSTLLKRRLKDHPEEANEVVDEIFKYIKDGSAKHLDILLNRTEGKVPDTTVIVSQIKVEITNKLGVALPAAMLQAGVTKAQGREVIDNLKRILIAGEETD
jgi:hypothetical protein